MVTVLDAWPKKIATPLPSAHAVQPEDEAKNDKTDKTEAKHDGDAATVTKTKAAPEARPLPPKEAKEPGHAPSPETAEPDKPTPESQFVKAVHDEACKDFGTVLGPEANEAHKNHFHLDMKARKHSSFCQ
mgnify:CR=1 FL=1